MDASRPLVLVPTMGALHAGHTSLFDKAREIAGVSGTVAATIFVNPTQFGPTEDLTRYPRPFEADETLCNKHGVDLLFAPKAHDVYADNFSTWVNEDSVSVGLCGGTRPGHFKGVCTVVLKLLMISQPTDAVFGKKDFQQCAVIARMLRDLDIPVQLHFAETVREPDGLALSSRNAYLSSDEREQAAVLYRVLLRACASVATGQRDAHTLKRDIEDGIKNCPLARLDYVCIVDANTLRPVEKINSGDVAALAVYFGNTRLIDNIQLL
jgi:pantoate--beta-alanine ligase